MFSAIPSEYCSGPFQPGGVQSGQRPAPLCFENSTWMPFAAMSTTLSAVVIGQLPYAGASLMIIEDRGTASTAAPGGTAGGVAGGVAAGGGPKRSVSVP